VLPLFPGDQLPDKPAGFDDVLRAGGSLRSTDYIANRLESTTDPVEKYWLWQALAEAWAMKCRPKDSDLRKLDEEGSRRVREAVEDGEVAYDLTTVDDFSMYRYKHSEMLDLDYLSPSGAPFVSTEELPAKKEEGVPSADAASVVMPRRRSFISNLLSWIRSN
jgi:hypothetical protein